MKHFSPLNTRKTVLYLMLFVMMSVSASKVYAQYVTYQDTSSMLGKYLRKSDTASMLKSYIKLQSGLPFTAQSGRMYLTDTIRTNGVLRSTRLLTYGGGTTIALVATNSGSGGGAYFQAYTGRAVDIRSASTTTNNPTVYIKNTSTGGLISANNNVTEVMSLSNNGELKSKSILTDTIKSISTGGGALFGYSNKKILSWNETLTGTSAVFHDFAGYDANKAVKYTQRSFTDKNYVDSSLALSLKISDSSRFLEPYLRKSDTGNIFSKYLKLQNTAAAELQSGKIYISDTLQTNGIFYGTRMGLSGNGVNTSLSVVNTLSANAAYFQAASGRAIFAINGSATTTNPTLFLKNFGTGGLISANNGTVEVMTLANNGALMAKSFLTDTIKSNTTAGGGLFSIAGKKLMSWGEMNQDGTLFYGMAGYNTNIAASYSSRSFTDKNYVDSSVALHVKVANLSALLDPYLQKTDTAQILSGYAKQVNVDTKLNKADTAAMLQSYARIHTLSSYASVSQLQNYLPLSGGTVSGTIFGTEGRFSGNLYVKKLVVAPNSWSDYVFDKTYKLRSLYEVEKFIQQNHHLPDVPSEKEVAAKGISVGENQAVLLRKIEELTLYIIEQQKRIEALEMQVHKKKQP